MLKIDFLIIIGAVIINSGAALLVKKGADAMLEGEKINSFTSALKHFQPAINGYTFTGLLLLGLSFILFIFIVSRVHISVAQPMFALAYIFIAVGAYFIFGEPFSVHKLLGIGAIIGGVYLISGGIR